MQGDKVLNLPAGYFGIVLGTIGMGFAWRYASQVWQGQPLVKRGWASDSSDDHLGIVFSAICARLLRFPHSVLAGFAISDEQFCGLFPATTMLVAIGLFRGFAHWRCACSVLVSWFSWLTCRLANCGIMARISS